MQSLGRVCGFGAIVGGAALLAGATTVNAQVVLNGGFEDNAAAFDNWPGYTGSNPGGGGTPGGDNPEIEDWVGAGGHGINRVEAGNLEAPFAPSGYNFGATGHFAFMQGAGTTLTQTIGGFTPGTSYTLNYLDATRAGNTGGLTAEIAGASLVTAPSAAEFTARTLAFTANAETLTLTFTNSSPAGDNTVDIDNVSIVIPEPTALGLVAFGGAALLARRRRRA
jgi:hypothetical protein